MTEPERHIPWGVVAAVAPLILILIGLLALVAGLKGALVGVVAAAAVFSLLLGVVWRARLVGGRRSVPVTPTLILALFSGVLLVLVLAVLVFIIR